MKLDWMKPPRRLLTEPPPVYAYRLSSPTLTITNVTSGNPVQVKRQLEKIIRSHHAYNGKWEWPLSRPVEPEPVGAVMLGTPRLASLLQDTKFCVQTINALFKAPHPRPRGWGENGPIVLPSHLTVLRAVVDGVIAPRLTQITGWVSPAMDSHLDRDDRAFASAVPSNGLAIAIGRLDDLLPGLAIPGGPAGKQMSQGSATNTLPSAVGNSARAALEFPIDWGADTLDGQAHEQGQMHMTVPLANTLFTTRKPFSAWAAHWRIDRDRQPNPFNFPAANKYVNPDIEWHPHAETIVVRLSNHQWQGPGNSSTDPEVTGERQQVSSGGGSCSKEVGNDHHHGKNAALKMAIHVELKPITRPRRIVAGLGNVMRQIRGPGGEPAPAARELEAAVHRVLADETRKECIAAAVAADEPPIVVWALLIPKPVMRHVVEEWGLQDPDEEAATEEAKARVDESDESSGGGDGKGLYRGDEVNTSKEQFVISPDMVPKLLAMGCQLRRILSGGGGWGPKQGLLALDPAISWKTEAAGGTDEPGGDMEKFGSFLASLQAGAEDEAPNAASSGHGQGSPSSPNVTPGSYVQFLVERSPFAPAEDTDRETRYWGFMPRLRLVVGSMPRLSPLLETKSEKAKTKKEERKLESRSPVVRAIRGWFGVASSAGFYVEAPSPSSSPLEPSMGPDAAGRGTQQPWPCMGTKIDVPGAKVSVARGYGTMKTKTKNSPKKARNTEEEGGRDGGEGER